MANTLYPGGKEAFLDGSINMVSDDIRVALLRNYTYSSSHDTLEDVDNSGSTVIVSRSVALADKTVTDGVFNASQATFAAVPAGTACGHVVLYKYDADDANARVIAHIDTATNLPVTPNGGDIRINWDTGPVKIFAL